jgi:Zn-dependent protease
MDLIILLLALVLAITLHEFAHALMGHYLGDDTARLQGRLTLNPVAHIDPFLTLLLPLVLILAHSPVVFGAARPVPFNPWAVKWGKWGAALVAAAGPLTNLLLAGFFALWLRVFMPSGAGAQLLVTMISLNAAFCVFNLIPFPPLDGSRILYAAAPAGLREVMDRIERSGMVAIVVFMFVGYPFIARYVAAVVRVMMEVLVPSVTRL